MSPPFVLVHGAWHSAACWQPLVDELGSRGEVAVAMDLPGDDPTATLDDYADAVVAAADHLDEPVVVVGHSLGGITIPLVAQRRPVAGLVFLAAVVAPPGEVPATVLVDDAFAEGYPELSEADLMTTDDGATWWRPDGEGAVAAFYHDVPAGLLDAAVGALRPQYYTPMLVPWPLDAYPDVPLRYIACTDDRILDPGWQLRMSKEVLGVDAELLHCSHSPMLSAPEALADLLVG